MTLRIALAQFNPIVGDLAGNAKSIIAYISRAKRLGADLVLFPELAVTGYPPEDLLLRPHFIEANLKAIDQVAEAARGVVVVCGFADRTDDVYNAAAVCAGGRIVARYHKVYLPNYGVFDENRYFQSGATPLVFGLGEARLGVTICEDIWQPGGPLRDEVLGGDAQVILNLSSSPFSAGKRKLRENMLAARAADNAVALVYCNLVGGQDELVFDGHSVVIDHEGKILCRAKGFSEDLVCVDLKPELIFRHRLRDLRHRQERTFYRELDRVKVKVLDLPQPAKRRTAKKPLPRPDLTVSRTPVQEVYQALVTGTHDYVTKNGFKSVLVGLSGGVDSALTAVIAADALGAKNLRCIYMPSRYSSGESEADAIRLAENLGCRLDTLPIEETFQAFNDTLAGVFSRRQPDETEENIQSRIRGTLLMALANKFGSLVLATGNKSEGSVGYATLYGDMAGGLSVIKDVPKVLVYDLCRERNRQAGRDLIPQNILKKAPTAELRPDQKDTDSLPEYEVLDPILKAYVEEDKNLDEIAAEGFDPALIRRVTRMVDLAEFKRRQSAPGIKITSRAFGKDRRQPITNRYRNK